MTYKLYNPAVAVGVIVGLLFLCGATAWLCYTDGNMILFVVFLCLLAFPCVLTVNTWRASIHVDNIGVTYGFSKKRISFSDIATIDAKDMGWGRQNRYIVGMGDYGFEIMTKAGKRLKISAGLLCSKKRCLTVLEIIKHKLPSSRKETP